MSKWQWVIKSKVGSAYLVASSKGIAGLHWRPQDIPLVKSLAGSGSEMKHLASADQQLREYFAGTRRDFDLAFDVDGTAFQKVVWRKLREIPYGKTISYGELAAKIGRKGAARAVGTANGRNPLSLFVPCHRVISADGTLGGYSGGLDIKSRLLELEKKFC